MTISDAERRIIFENLASRRAILRDDPAAFFIDVAEACLQEYHEKTAAALARFEQNLQQALSQSSAEFAKVKSSSNDIATALADLTRRVNSLDPATTMTKIVADTYDKTCSSIAYRSTQHGYDHARQLFERELDRNFWVRITPALVMFLIMVASVLFGMLLMRWGMLV